MHFLNVIKKYLVSWKLDINISNSTTTTCKQQKKVHRRKLQCVSQKMVQSKMVTCIALYSCCERCIEKFYVNIKNSYIQAFVLEHWPDIIDYIKQNSDVLSTINIAELEKFRNGDDIFFFFYHKTSQNSHLSLYTPFTPPWR